MLYRRVLNGKPFVVSLVTLLGIIAVSLAVSMGRPARAQEHSADTPTAPAAETQSTAEVHGNPTAGESAEAPASHENTEDHGEGHAKGNTPLAWTIPFVLLLGCIAIMPLINLHFWEHKYPYFAAAFFVVGLCYYLLVRGDMHPWLHEMQEYVSFICLLFALYVVSGGIVIHVSRKATPMANCTLLLIGAVIANIFGTTGAAMLLIRPYIRINRKHIKPFHIVFFIFIVANAGGCLTPIGDPPLFLGYLRGVPFWWFIEACWQPWAVATIVLLLVFFVLDKRDHAREERFHPSEHDTGPAVRINGIFNFLFIALVIVAVFQDSVFHAGQMLSIEGVNSSTLLGLIFSREVIMVAVALVSKVVTKRGIYEVNEFTWAPIREVAILFVAIFSTMVPALQWLDANAEKLPLKTPGQYYYLTGTLSSCLDNAPTFLTFYQTQTSAVASQDAEQFEQMERALVEIKMKGHEMPVIPEWVTDGAVRRTLHEAITYHGDAVTAGTLTDSALRAGFMTSSGGSMNGYPVFNFLLAISIGAVFFGAMTYIGNAPNFMVKSIAESSGIKMPSFLGYMFKYSIPLLVPIYIVIWAIFLL